MAIGTRMRVDDRVRALTSRRWGIPLDERIRKLNQYMPGSMGYFRLIDTTKVLKHFDIWFRRRLLQTKITANQVERMETRARVWLLRLLGAPPDLPCQRGQTSPAYWRIAKSPILHRALSIQY